MGQSQKHTSAINLRNADEPVVPAGTLDSTGQTEQHHDDSGNQGSSYDGDSSDAAEEYRLASNPERPPKKPLVQNSEHAAFMSWVANEAYQDDIAESKDELGNVEGFVTIVESGTSPTKIVTTPRQYQLDLFERAKQQNTIIVLDTGSGKTYIAVLLLRHVLALELENQDQTRKTAFFVVDKVALCLQQHRFLQANLEYPVGKLYGDKASMGEWASEIQENMIVVCTAQILLDLLNSGLVRLNQVNLLVFDEAHHTKKSHPYARIMRHHYARMKTARPRILGMTASPVDSKTRDFYAAAVELEATLCSKIATVSEEALLDGMGRKQQIERLVEYGPLVDPADAMTMTALSQSLSTICASLSKFQSHLEAARHAASIIGSWGADQYWRQVFKSRDQSLAIADLSDSTIDELIATEMGTCCQMEEQMDGDLINQRAKKLVTDYFCKEPTGDFSLKVRALYEILHDAFETNQNTRCIVFVQKRYIAFLLSELFNQSVMRVSQMAAGFLVGSQQASSNIIHMSIKDQTEALDRFRYGQTNCIFATQVAEEGIDIPECDLIIRFDLYDSAIQYIQSKGRARQADSVYVNMIERDNIHHRRKLMQATRDVHTLRRFCSSLPSDRKIKDMDDSQLELQAKSQLAFEVPETGARLTFDSSRQVLARFISSVCSGTADAHPEYVVTPANTGKFIATVLLPDSCPVKSFTGTPQSSKLLARGSATFKACIDLLNLKYIDGNFRSTLTRLLPKMRNARLALSDRKQSEYGMKSKPGLWARSATSQFFVTTLSIEGPGPTGRPGRPLCILTRSALPTMEPIRLWIENDIQSTVAQEQFADAITLSKEEVASLVKFTLILFNDVFSKDFDCDSDIMPYFLAPCVHSTTTIISLNETGCLWNEQTIIDWSLVQRVKAACAPTCPDLLSNPGDFTDRFIIDSSDGSRKFFTCQVNKAYHAFDPVPKGVPLPKSRSYFRVQNTIAQYSNSLSYKSRQSITWNAEQPVFDARLLPLRRDLLREPHQGDIDSSRDCFVILEPLAVSTLPIEVVVTALALPVTIYSIESAAIAMEACELIDLGIHPPLALEALTKGEEDVDTVNGKNYERLEFLGDAFLKMATTISLFTLIPNRNEFEYHVERMILICNKNLFNHAVDRGLQKYVRSKGFDRRSWYPDLVLRKGKKNKPVLTHRLADKSIADVCEALIGAAYMTEPESMDLAVKAVTTMVRSKNHKMKKYSDYYERYVPQTWQAIPPRPVELHAAAVVEGSIGYKFGSAKLLRSAFKHPSYPYESELPNYQRLEFLGDALLDVTIVDFLFRRYPLADPQWLTEHKMAMTSNHFFSFLCVQLGLHRHILTTGSTMMGNIAGFVEQIDKAKSQADGGVLKPNFWLNTQHPPKALSDTLEAVVGAMFEDSKYDYGTVRNFFTKFIAPYFQDMALYDTYAAGHPVTQLTKLIQDTFRCRSWRLCVSSVPCGSETGASAITDSNVVCALMIHGKKTFHSIRGNGRDAKITVAAAALKQMKCLDRAAFRAMTGCDCGLVD